MNWLLLKNWANQKMTKFLLTLILAMTQLKIFMKRNHLDFSKQMISITRL